MLGTLHLGPLWQQSLGLLLVAGMVLGWTRLQGVALQLKEKENESRWASTLRDGLNLFLVATLWSGFALVGLPAPAAFLFAGTVGIALDVIRHAARTAERRNRIIVVGVLPVATALALLPGPALSIASRVAGFLSRF